MDKIYTKIIHWKEDKPEYLMTINCSYDYSDVISRMPMLYQIILKNTNTFVHINESGREELAPSYFFLTPEENSFDVSFNGNVTDTFYAFIKQYGAGITIYKYGVPVKSYDMRETITKDDLVQYATEIGLNEYRVDMWIGSKAIIN